jgi:hypothetical protein
VMFNSTFEEYLERSENYFSVIREANDLPWYDDPDRAAKVAAQLGLAADTPALDLRRALFERGRR